MLTTLRKSRHIGRSINPRYFSSSQYLCRETPRWQHAPPNVPSIHQSLDSTDLDDFRTNAFIPEQPVVICRGNNYDSFLPAEKKWFTHQYESDDKPLRTTESKIEVKYLSTFADTILPYEFYNPGSKQKDESALSKKQRDVLFLLHNVAQSAPTSTFHRFNAPLSLFLSALTISRSHQPNLYIAQAQIADLPQALRDDLPTPLLVSRAGKGDIYDANLWMGIPPTYTPLHKDPNPNLFFQLASRKRIRLLAPRAGLDVFRMVQEKVGQHASSIFRGNEMMEGAERDELERAVWDENTNFDGLEAQLEAGDALFIPKGWWHSVKSEGEHVNASVNWWFR